MQSPIYDSNEDRSDELSPNEVAELETTLRSFLPRKPLAPVSRMPSPARQTQRESARTNWRALGATWVSGAIAGALAVFLFGQVAPEPQPVTPQTTVVTQQVVDDTQHEVPPTEIETSSVVLRSEKIDRLFSDPWLESNCLSASSHLAVQATPKPKTLTTSSDEREFLHEANPSPTKQQLLRALLNDPDSVL